MFVGWVLKKRFETKKSIIKAVVSVLVMLFLMTRLYKVSEIKKTIDIKE